MSPLSEEIRQRAARWRNIRDNCPDLTVNADGSNTNETPLDQQDQKQQPQPKSRNTSELVISRSTKKRSSRLRYGDVMNSKMGESWHPQSDAQVTVHQKQTPNGKDTRATNRRNLFKKTNSVPDFGSQSSQSKLGSYLQNVPGATVNMPQGDEATQDESIEDSLRPFSEVRVPPHQLGPHTDKSGMGNTTPSSSRVPKSRLDDFLDALIFDARKSRIDAATTSVGSKPRRSSSSRASRSKKELYQDSGKSSGKVSSHAFGTVSGDRVSLTFVGGEDQQDQKRTALDPPQVISKKKSKDGSSTGLAESRRGKDPPGKVKRPGALGGFLDKGRARKHGRPTGAATVAGDQVARRLKARESDDDDNIADEKDSRWRQGSGNGCGDEDSNHNKNGKGGKERSILDAILSQRRSASRERRRLTAVAPVSSPGTLKRAYSMSVVGQGTVMGSDTIRTGDTDILSDIGLADSPPKTNQKKSGPQLGSFLDRRRQPHSRKSGANTVAGDRVAVRHTKSMGRSTKEVLRRLEADKKGETLRKASESPAGDKVGKKGRNPGWRPRRSRSNLGVESSSVAARLRLQQIESASEESDVILNSERIFERSADKSTDSNDSDEEEDGFDPHISTSQLDLEGFWDRKNSRVLRSRKPEAHSVSGRRTSRGKAGTRAPPNPGNRRGGRNMRYSDADVQSSVFGESWRRPRPKSQKSEDHAPDFDIIGSMLEPEEDGDIALANNGARRPRVGNNAEQGKSSATKPMSRRMMMKMQSLSSLGLDKGSSDAIETGGSLKNKAEKTKSNKKSPTAVFVGSEKQFDKGSRGRSSALAEEIYIREDGKKVRRVHRKAIDGEIITRPDGTKVRIRRKNRLSRGSSSEVQSKDDLANREPGQKSKSWLDQYLDGDDLPLASGHSRPGVGKSVSSSIGTGEVETADTKPLSLTKILRDSETADESKQQSLRPVRDNRDSGSDSGGEAPATPLSVKERREMFRKINSVPTMMAASPLVTLYDKKPNDQKDRIRRALDAPDSPRKDKAAAESDPVAKRGKGSPTRRKKALSVQGGNVSLSLLDLYDKRGAKDPVKPVSAVFGNVAEQVAPSGTKCLNLDENVKRMQSAIPTKNGDRKRDDDNKRQLLQNSSKLRKVQSLSNLGHRQYDMADRQMLVERLKTLSNDARLTPLRSRPKVGQGETADTNDSKKAVRSASRERAGADARRTEALTPNTLRRLRKVSSHSDISSITRQSSQSQAEVSKALQLARWKSPAEKTIETAVKSPRRRLSNDSSAGSLERNILAKAGIPSIDLEADVSPGAEISPSRPSSARTNGSAVTAPPSSLRTLNSASTPTPPASARALNSETGSKKELPPGLPMRKQSLHPAEANVVTDGSPDPSDKGQPPLAPRKKNANPPTSSAPSISAGAKASPSDRAPAKDKREDTRPSLLTLGPPQSPFRRSLARWSSVPKDLGSTVNSNSLTKDDVKDATKFSDEKGSQLKKSKASSSIEKTDDASSKSRGSGAQFPAPGSHLLVYDDASTVCSDITDCWTNEVISNRLAAETRRRAAGHNRRATYDLGSIINEEAGVEGSSRLERSPLQDNRWESASKLTKEVNESLPHPKRPADDSAPKEDVSSRFGWLKKLSFPRVKSDGRSDEGALLGDQSNA